jgi:hypothetical protein
MQAEIMLGVWCLYMAINRHTKEHAQARSPVTAQVEIDYKAECAAGDTVDCFGARLTEPSAAATNVNGTGAGRSGLTVYN